MNISAFRGLCNVTDAMRLGLGSLTQADNINITDTGAITKRDGYALSKSGAYKSVYTTLNFQRMYLVDGLVLKTFDGAVICNLTSSSPMHWTEVNEQVFFNNGSDDGIINPDNEVLPWRASVLDDLKFLAADGTERDNLFDPLPLTSTVIQHWRGRIYAAMYMPAENQTVVWFSQALGYHLFNLDSDFFMVPGEVTMLAPHDSTLIVGAGDAIYAYTGDKLSELADYGVVPGKHWAADDNRTLFWTLRGLCAAVPFVNLTEKSVSVAPGVLAGGTIVRSGGQRRYLTVLQQGGTAFNSL